LAPSPFTPSAFGGSEAMVISLIYGAAVVAVAVYMVAALLRPDKF
jgi:K+-transporting ATPase KdpF subunit